MTSTQNTDRARQVLVRALQAAYPHANVPRGPYERTADKLIADAAGSAYNQATLQQGLADLEALAGGDFVGLSNADGYKILKRIESTPFFGAAQGAYRKAAAKYLRRVRARLDESRPPTTARL